MHSLYILVVLLSLSLARRLVLTPTAPLRHVSPITPFLIDVANCSSNSDYEIKLLFGDARPEILCIQALKHDGTFSDSQHFKIHFHMGDQHLTINETIIHPSFRISKCSTKVIIKEIDPTPFIDIQLIEMRRGVPLCSWQVGKVALVVSGLVACIIALIVFKFCSSRVFDPFKPVKKD
ncbi:hypothetical protein P9112_001272 [Eukaryota sp. TZLM1-RC]